MKIAPSLENEGANFALFIAEKGAKISASGQTCGQRRKKGLFNPKSREEQAHDYIAKTRDFKRFCEINKEKSGILRLPIFGLSVRSKATE